MTDAKAETKVETYYQVQHLHEGFDGTQVWGITPYLTPTHATEAQARAEMQTAETQRLAMRARPGCHLAHRVVKITKTTEIVEIVSTREG